MTQHRVRIYQTGGPAVMQYETLAAEPAVPGPGQVRLAHEAIGLNFVDTLLRDGSFNVPMPFDMGVEGAGVIEAVGEDVTGLRAGDRAAYFFNPGSYSSTRLLDASALIRLPDDIDSELAASLFTKGLTAWMLLRQAHRVQAGETVLVHGAAGGVGSLLTVWAKALGATVIASVGSLAKADSVRAQGIDHVLHSGDPEFLEKLRRITDGRGVDVVYELVGKATFALSVAGLREGGTLVHPGNASGAPAPEDKASLPGKNIRYVQPTTSQYVGERAALEQASAELFDAYRTGLLGRVNARRYPLSEVIRAHEDLAARRIVGAAILIP